LKRREVNSPTVNRLLTVTLIQVVNNGRGISKREVDDCAYVITVQNPCVSLVAGERRDVVLVSMSGDDEFKFVVLHETVDIVADCGRGIVFAPRVDKYVYFAIVDVNRVARVLVTKLQEVNA
jgi:hypothetical protein